ncbi:MAG TPA: DNA polymerase II large subunit [Candidatus Woesearchaeota archaeon]|nr:DNA polymerase II large subunit [Candidatus Woesearchaeota archaeon]
MKTYTEDLENYFNQIEKEVNKAYSLAEQARKKGYDPEQKVDIPLAKGIAQRVEGLISADVPQIMNSGVAVRISKLEKQYGTLDWRVALKIAEEVATEKFFKLSSKQKALETGIRVGLAYITLGVISAPLEGFIELKIKKRRDGKEYLSAFYAGPIRAAGGTAEAVSLIITDYVRLKTGYLPYDPTEKEIKRTVTEITDYHARITNLQYLPSEEEITFLLRNLPIEVNGDPTETMEVSNYKDLPRVETNRIRGGVCLVLAEGMAQKARKLNKQLKRWGKDFGLNWSFLDDFLELQKKVKAKGEKQKETKGILPDYTYVKDLVAGRPVLSFPMRYGGLRLRYGRTRTTGLAAAAIHPQTMWVLNKYIATGTQLKLERPGKAASIVACDSIDGPIVKLKNGTVTYVKEASSRNFEREDIEKILFLGDILFNYGDFSENGHPLVPVGYCQEWWIKDFEKAIISLFGSLDIDKTSVFLKTPAEHIKELFNKPISTQISSRLAFRISKQFNIPLHPVHTYYWTNITSEDLLNLSKWIASARIKKENNKLTKLILETSGEKEILEKIGLPHLLVNKEYVVIEKEHATTLYLLFMNKNLSYIKKSIEQSSNILLAASCLAGVKIKDKAGTFIGARMGRPEKAKMRKLTGSPHFLFPVGEEGGRLRSIQSALDAGKITAEFPVFFCQNCKKETIFSICEDCNQKTQKAFYCKKCGIINKKCSHDFVFDHRKKSINIKEQIKKALIKADIHIFPDLIKGVRGTSNKDHVPEHIIKGVLRAKHSIAVNKDGTTRYDMIELPITHFKPKEIDTNIETLIKLGYTRDINGKKLVKEDQILELKPQDLILPAPIETGEEPADEILLRVTNYVDDLLEKLYKLPAYYDLKSKKDLIGQLVIGLAPHTSAGTIGRIIGFSKTQGMFAHPLFHAAMRRNCDGDEACVILLMDALLNFSRSFLPDKRGSRTMDAPLVLTSLLVPSEVDDEVHGMDIVWEYPLEFYEAAAQYKLPWEVDVLQIDNVLNTRREYEKMGYTHTTTNINQGILCSAYKQLPTMEEKLRGQMDLAEKIVAVESGDVAQLVIEKHFLKDIKGNLRKFSTQQFRCVKCNAKYRRPPLVGKCLACGGRIIFTISEGSVIKYLEPTLSLANKYKVSNYLLQSLEFLQKQIDSILGRAKDRQEGLGKWFG